MQQQTLTIINKLGLHARAAARLVKVASGFESRIEIHKGSEQADAKSIMDVMMLGAGRGTQLQVRATGPDEIDALNAVCDLINDRFAEEE